MSFQISDIPLIEPEIKEPVVIKPPADDLTTANRLDEAARPPSLVPVFGENPWDVAQREADALRQEERSVAQAKIDSIALDPEPYFKGKDLGFTRDPKKAQMLTINSAFMEFASGDMPVPLGEYDIQRKLMRQELAIQLFDGRGKESEEAFHGEIVKAAQGRKDDNDLFQGLEDEAVKAVTVGSVGDKAVSFKAWREQAMSKPGYKPGHDADYLEAWNEIQRESRARIEPFRDELAQVWQAMKAGGAGSTSEIIKSIGADLLLAGGADGEDTIDELQKKDAGAVAFEVYEMLGEEDRAGFMGALHTMVKSFPKEEQAAVLANLGKSGGRMVDDIGRGIASRFTLKGLEEQMNREIAHPMGPMGDMTKRKALENANRIQADRLLQKNFSDTIRKMERDEYAPIRHFSKDSKDFFSWRMAENGLYGVPGVLASVGTVMIPGVGPGAMFLAMEDFAYADLRDNAIRAGASELNASLFAEEWKTAAAVPQTGIELAQTYVPLGKIPMVNKVLGELGDKISNRLIRAGAKTLAINGAETAVEELQHLTPYGVQELAHAFAADTQTTDAEWYNGTDGAFDGFWTRQATTFISMLPLAMGGAMGGLNSEARARAFAESTPLQRRAFGISEADSEAIDAAKARGQSSLNAAVSDAMERRAPESDEAKSAVVELENQIAGQKAMMEDARASGMLPTIVQSADGKYSVIDNESGEIVGIAEDPQQAMRLAAAHSSGVDEMKDEVTDYIINQMEAGAEALALAGDANAQNSFELSTHYTAAVAAAENPESIDQFAKQAADRELINGGNGEVALSALGRNVADIRNQVRTFTNRLFQGSSVRTIIHETGHGMLSRAWADGSLTRAETLQIVQTINKAMGERRMKKGAYAGEKAALMDEAAYEAGTDADKERMLHEAVAEFLEANMMKGRKLSAEKSGMINGGTVNKNIKATARYALSLLPKPLRTKFETILNAVRGVVGMSAMRAVLMKKAIRDGEIKQADIDAFLDKLTGRNLQAEHDSMVRDEHAAILGQEASLVDEDNPFSLGRATVTPTAETRTFEGTQGETVIGAAYFSISAYHGTPHKVDKFTTAKMGTGEGAQAYGWGLYFAEQQGIADGYRKELSKNIFEIDGKPFVPRNFEITQIANAWSDPQDTKKALLAYVSRNTYDGEVSPFAEVDDALAIIKAIDEGRFNKPETAGNLYRVTLKVEDEDLLDWDKPLSEQSEKVKKALGSLGGVIADAANSSPISKEDGDYWEYAGETYDSRREAIEDWTAGKLTSANHIAKTPQEVSARLHQAGIRGIRYLDGNARGMRVLTPKESNSGKWVVGKWPGGGPEQKMFEDTPEGEKEARAYERELTTYNYVIFDEADIEIVEENGTPVKLGDGNPFSLNRANFDGADGTPLQQAEKFLRTLSGKELVTADGLTAMISNKSAAKMTSHKAVQKSASPEAHLAAIENIEDLFSVGSIVETAPDKNNDENIRAIHRIVAPFDFEGKSMAAKFTVKELAQASQGNRIYSIEAIETENAPEGKWTDATSASGLTSAPRSGAQEIDLTKQDGSQGGESSPFLLARAYSLAPSSFVDSLSVNASSRTTNPKARMAVFTRMLAKLGDLKRDKDELGVAFGKGYKRKAIEDPRKRASINRESAFREASRRSELEEQAHAKHNGILDNEDLAKLKAQPVHGHLADPSTPLKGRVMSRTQALSRGENFFNPEKQGDYDGAANVSRAVFGGNLAPDQAAQELYDAGLIKEPTADAMWQALEREAASVKKMKTYMDAARSDVVAARVQAKAEAKAWKEERIKEEEANYSPKARLLRALAMLDGIISALPIAERGRIGGYTQLAKLGTDEARLKFLNERIEKVDEVVEKWLKKEFGQMLDKLMERAKPAKGKPGEKPKGKAGADVHSLFDVLRVAQGWNADNTQAHHDKLMAIVTAGEIDDGKGGKRPLTPSETAHMSLEANLVLQIGDWKNKNAAQRAAAVENATKVFETGYYQFKLEKLLEKEDRDIRREQLKKDTGTSADLSARQERQAKDLGVAGSVRKGAWYLRSFADVVEGLFGRHSVEGQRLVDLERSAAFQSEDANQADWNEVNDLFKALSGGKSDFDGWKMRSKMTEKTVSVNAPLTGRPLTFSQFEAVDILLTWRRGQGKQHMFGSKDENAKPSGKWHYNQNFVDAVESQITPEGRVWMSWLSDQYRAEWELTNPTFVRLQGINLPRDPAYYPLSVKPLNDKGADMLDPVTGLAMTPGSGSPGFLKAINPGAIAEPDFQDSLQKFLTHRRQLNHWLAYAPVIAEASPILGNRDLMNYLEARGGKEGADTLRDWISYFTQGGHRDAAARKWYNRMIQMGLDRASGAILIGRMSVLAVQSIQLGAAQAEMSVSEYLPRLAKLLFSADGWKMWRAAYKSSYIQRRIQQMPPALRAHHEQLMRAKPTRIRHWQSRMGETIAGADGLFTAGTYAMILDQRKARLKTEYPNASKAEIENAAHAEATRLTEKLAQPTRSGTRSLMELQSGVAMRTIWNFSSEPRQKIMLAALRLTNSEYTYAEKARTAFVVWGIGGMMLSIVRAALRDIRDDGEDDEIFDERNWSIKRMALESALGPFQGVPFVGDAINATTYAVSGEYRAEGGMFSAIPKGVKSGVAIWESQDPGEVIRHAENILTGASFFNDNAAAAASFSHVLRDVYGISENLTEDD